LLAFGKPTPKESIPMNTKIFAAVACAFWSAAYLSSSTPAAAYAITSQAGGYATCTASYTPASNSFQYCQESGVEDPYMGTAVYTYNTNYIQQIKFISTACNGGPCNSGSDIVYTESVYGVGRKVVYGQAVLCGGSNAAYTLGTCDC
jgi:hypothetical protein